jgi:hypothetical protein
MNAEYENGVGRCCKQTANVIFLNISGGSSDFPAEFVNSPAF